MRIKFFFYSACLMLLTMAAVSCSSDDDDNTAALWASKNTEYFQKVYCQANDSIKAGSKNWKVLKAWMKSDSQPGSYTDSIVVRVISSSTSTVSPLSSDSVYVHYEGRYIPGLQLSEYPNERQVFDCSWTGSYDLTKMNPTVFSCFGVVWGFSTALVNMHVGDRWEVTVPYQLGYGSTEKSSIPACSTLIFDVTLQKIK